MTPTAKAVRDAIMFGTRCLLCGAPKQLGADYCEKHRDEEAAEMQSVRAARQAPK